VLSEGINHDHKEFEGRAFDGEYRRLTRSRKQENCKQKYHGTHVASLAVGKSVGVATKANVYRYELFIDSVCHAPKTFYMLLVTHNYLYPYSINVLDCQLTGFFSEVIRGIHYVINRTKLTGRRSVIALPLLGPQTDAFDVAAEEAVKQNIVLVAAAGG